MIYRIEADIEIEDNKDTLTTLLAIRTDVNAVLTRHPVKPNSYGNKDIFSGGALPTRIYKLGKED